MNNRGPHAYGCQTSRGVGRKCQGFHTYTQRREPQAEDPGTSSEITLLFSKVSIKCVNIGQAEREIIYHVFRNYKGCIHNRKGIL